MADKDTAYCVRCKAKSTMKDTHVSKTKNGRKVLKGTCTKCGTRMNKFLKNDDK